MHPIGGPAALAFVEEQLCRAARMRVAVTGATQGVLLH
jgi:hypothetical protein